MLFVELSCYESCACVSSNSMLHLPSCRYRLLSFFLFRWHLFMHSELFQCFCFLFSWLLQRSCHIRHRAVFVISWSYSSHLQLSRGSPSKLSAMMAIDTCSVVEQACRTPATSSLAHRFSLPIFERTLSTCRVLDSDGSSRFRPRPVMCCCSLALLQLLEFELN